MIFFSQIVFENTSFVIIKKQEIGGILKLKSFIFIWWEVWVYTRICCLGICCLQLESVSSKNYLIPVVWSSF
jgi:hypothetical protein